MGVDCLTFVTT